MSLTFQAGLLTGVHLVSILDSVATTIRPVKIDAQKRVIANGSHRRVVAWRVTLGKKITGDRKHRRFFKTYKAANQFIEDSSTARVAQGQEAFSIPQKLRVEAMECEKRLQPHGVSLTKAVDYYLRHAVPKGGVRTFSILAKEFMESRRLLNCRVSTMRLYSSYLRILENAIGKRRVNEIHTTDLEGWLADYQPRPRNGEQPSANRKLSPRTRKNYIVTLRTVFGYAISKGYCASNPAEHLDAPLLDDKPAGILTPEQASALLAAAVARMPDLLPGIAIGLFAGLRRSEICSLDWAEVDIDGRGIEVKASKAKTRQRRVVTIPENLAKWLTPRRKQEGCVAPPADAFGKALRDLVRGVNVTQESDTVDQKKPVPIVCPWPPNALRHSFGSYFYGKTKNENLTAAEMGNSPAVVHAHYKAVVREPAISQYWSILPA